MPTDNLLALAYGSEKSILTTKDFALLWNETSPNNLKAKISYYVKHGDFIRLSRGIFAKNNDYEPKELATSIYIPAYISFETVLREAGIIFQHYDTIFVATSRSKSLIIGTTKITFRKLKDELLYHSAGIINRGTYSIATPERAFLDMLYLSPNYYFDNLHRLNWQICFELAPLYGNKQLIKRLKNYQKLYAEQTEA